MRIRNITPLFAAAMLLLCSCRDTRPESHVYEGFALGTFYNIIIKGKVSPDLQQKIDSVFAESNASLSVFNPASLLSRLNRNETDFINGDIFYCIELARSVSELSGGRYDITVQPLMEAYGFREGKQNENVDVDSALRYVGYKKISIREGRLVKEHPETQIDLNSIAKGLTVDKMGWMLDSEGITEYMVNVGGEIFCRGKNREGHDWVIGIETPVEGNYVHGNDVQYIFTVSGKGVATSGNYRNFHTDSEGRKFTHIVNPLTGESTTSNLLSATVIAESCALADALGTMFIALGLESSVALLDEHPELAAMLIFADEEGEMKLLFSEAMRPFIPEQQTGNTVAAD